MMELLKQAGIATELYAAVKQNPNSETVHKPETYQEVPLAEDEPEQFWDEALSGSNSLA